MLPATSKTEISDREFRLPQQLGHLEGVGGRRDLWQPQAVPGKVGGLRVKMVVGMEAGADHGLGRLLVKVGVVPAKDCME